MMVAAKRVHAATIDKTEHAFAATGIYPYRPNVVSGEDFEPPKIISKGKMPDEDLGIQMVTLPFVSMVLICLYLPLHDHLII
jgi:hypothetical protein